MIRQEQLQGWPSFSERDFLVEQLGRAKGREVIEEDARFLIEMGYLYRQVRNFHGRLDLLLKMQVPRNHDRFTKKIYELMPERDRLVTEIQSLLERRPEPAILRVERKALVMKELSQRLNSLEFEVPRPELSNNPARLDNVIDLKTRRLEMD